MAWENIITGYTIVLVKVGETVGKDWIFIAIMEAGHYGGDRLIYQKPIYKKKNIKKATNYINQKG